MFLRFVSLFLILAAPAQAIVAAPLVRIEPSKGGEIITLTVPKRAPHKVFTLPSPDRLVVDVPSVPGKRELSLPGDYRGTLVRALRFGQFDPQTSRFVFDLAHPVKIGGVQEAPGSLIITIRPSDIQGEQVFGDKRASGASELSFRKVQTPAAKPAKGKPAKPIVVIDPGHGGVDPGTSGVNGTQEKDITLAFAKALKARLIKSGRYVVKLTHDDDQFVMLRKRVEIARQAGADVFISLHADSAPEASARGLSVYTLSEQASDKETAALAARQNKSDILAGLDLSEQREDVAGILISLAERETKNRSATLADILVTKLDDKVELLPNTHRFAGFAVLKAPDIPAVLIEIGFLSHPGEEKLLNSRSYREKITAGIESGIDAYFRHEQQMGGL